MFHVAGQPVRLAREEIAEVVDDPPVFFCADAFDTRRRAFVYVAQQTRPTDLPVPLEDSRGTCAGRKHPGEQIEGFPNGPGVRIRPEVANGFASFSLVDHHAL